MLATVVAVLIAATALWYGGNPAEITAAISLITWWSIALGVACRLIPVSDLTRTALIAVTIFASLALLTGLSFFWSNNEGLAFDKTVQMICLVGLFTMALLCSKPGSARAWLQGIAFGLAFLTLLAAMSRYFPGLGDDQELRETLYGSVGRLSWPLGYWNADGAVATMAILTVGWFAAVARDVRWRIACTATLPVFFLVLYLTSSRGALVALVFAAVLLFVMEPQRKRLLVASVTGVLGGAVLVLIAAQMFDLVHANSGSNAWVEGISLFAVTIAVVAVTVLLLNRYESRLVSRPIPRPTMPVWIGISLVVVAGVIWINPVRQVDNFIATPDISQTDDGKVNLTTYHLLSATGNGRWQYWTAATSAFKEKPIAGIGAGSYRDYYTNHRETLLSGRHPHSLPLRFLGELGLIGFLLGGGFLFFVLWTGWTRWRTRRGSPGQTAALNAPESGSEFVTEAIPPLAALILAGMVSMSLDWTSEFPVIAAPILIAMAALVGPATIRPGRKAEVPAPPVTDSKSDSGRTSLRNLFPRELAPVLVVLGSGAAILFSAWGFGISHGIESSQDALAAGNNRKAVDEARDAVDLAPWSADALIQLAAGQEVSGNYIGALATLDRAVVQAPLEGAPWLAKARIQTALGDDISSFQSLVRAKQLDPYSTYFILVDQKNEALGLPSELPVQ